MDKLALCHHTSEDIGEFAARTIAVQPIGSTEQHGKHLPVGTDSLINNAVVNEVKKLLDTNNIPATFLPLLPYGKSNEHLNFPGTITFTAETLMRVLEDISSSCARAGFNKLVFLNTHGGNHEILDFMVREIRIATGMQAFVIHPFLKINPDNLNLEEKEAKFGIHAGKIETSIMLAANPTLVKTDRYEKDYPKILENKNYLDFSERIPFGWITEDVSKSGTIGDPRSASAEEGEILLKGVAKKIFEVMVEISNFSA